jgi:hypothetical protein
MSVDMMFPITAISFSLKSFEASSSRELLTISRASAISSPVSSNSSASSPPEEKNILILDYFGLVYFNSHICLIFI